MWGFLSFEILVEMLINYMPLKYATDIRLGGNIENKWEKNESKCYEINLNLLRLSVFNDKIIIKQCEIIMIIT